MKTFCKSNSRLMGAALAALLLLCAAVGLIFQATPSHVEAQSALTSTTTSAAMTATDSAVSLTSDSGVSAGTLIYIGGELMEARSEIGTTGRWNVRRGLGDGLTRAVGHPSGTKVWINGSTGAGAAFQNYDLAVGSTCTATQYPYQPVINTKLDHKFECTGGIWVQWTQDEDHPASFTARENFDAGTAVMQDDGTAKSLTDAEVNIVFGSSLGAITYREEQAKTASSWIQTNGVLDISADGTNNEGVEIVFGNGTDPTLNQWLEVGSQGGCIAAAITLADVSGTDNLMIGFRQNEAFQDAADYTGYTRWNTVGKAAADGVIVSQQEVNGATVTDTAAQTWADGETRALKVCLSKSGVPSAYVSDAFTPSLSNIDRPKYNAITMTNSGGTQTSGTGMVPFLTFLHGADVSENTQVQWVELLRLP